MTIFLFIFAAIICGIVYVAITVKADLLSLAIALAVVLLILGAFALVEKALQLNARRKLFRKMKLLGKYMDWNEVAPKLASGDGTAIINCKTLYWHPGDVSAAVLERLMSEAFEQRDLDNDRIADILGFLTKCPRRLLTEKSICRAFPHARVVDLCWSMTESIHVE